MHACVSVPLSCPLSLSLCVWKETGVFVTVAQHCRLALQFSPVPCMWYSAPFWFIGCSVFVSLVFHFDSFFFSSVIGVPSSFIAICFRCVVFLTSFYGVLSPPLWFKKKDTSLSCNLNCGFGCTAFSGWRVITHWDPNALLHYQIDSDKPMSCEAKICSFKVPLIYWL